MAEDRFGAARRIAGGQIPEDLTPGDRVSIIGGRFRGGKAVLEEIEAVPTPSGREVQVARVRRPRAGLAWEFPDMLRRIEG